MVIKKGDKVKVEYTGTFDDGTVFDSSTHDDHSHPIEFKVGAGQVVPGFDKAVIGMKKGEKKKFRLESSEAYGEPKKKLIKKVPRDKMPPNIKEGMMIGIGLPDGRKIPARVKKITEQEVTIDLNHPLAGKDLNFEIKVVSINESPESS